MRAGELARAYPVISSTASAGEAGRMLAQEDIDVLLVQGEDGVAVGALHDIGLLSALLPHYLVEDRALARVVGEGDADTLWARLDGKAVADLLASHAAPLPTVPQDATLIQVAAEMCATGVALVAVVDGTTILGGVTTSALLTQLLPPVSAVLAVAVFVGAYILIASDKIDRVKVALGGAALMLALGIVDSEEAFSSKETGIDWDVIFLLLGMMIIVGVLRQTGVFDYVAIWAAKKAKGKPFRVMTLLVVITAVASAMLDNVTTVLLIAPVTILICERLKAPPVPFLLAEVFASNIGGTATLIGDPPNIIIASQSGLTYMDFLSNLAPLVVVLMFAFVLLCRVMFRSAFTYRPEQVAEVMALDEREAITDRPLLVRSLAVLALVTVLFALHSVLHYEVSVIALLGAGLLVLLARRDPKPFLDEVEWPTLIFFGGLFIMVGALVHVGVVGDLAQAATDATDGRVGVASGVLLGGSAVLSAIVDNIPYVATMSPLVDSLIQGLPAGTDGDVLWWSLALGADLGGNATAIGASANVVVMGIAARNGYPIGFWQFTKYGLVVTAVTLGLSAPYVWLRYFVLA